MSAAPEIIEQLCLACGLCCNGVLFKDVELQPSDEPEKLAGLGLSLEKTRTKTRFAQPCAALCAGNRCRIYAERPARCREFECALLKSVLAGRQEVSSALKIIRATSQRAERVRRLLRELGCTAEAMPLSRRFRRMQRSMESGKLTEEIAATYGELTLAVHDLNLALRRSFYP